MTPAIAPPSISFEDYVAYSQGTEVRCELVDGRLIEMTPPVLEHFLIAKFLEKTLDGEINRGQQPWLCFREAGVRTGLRKSRITDVCIVTLEQARELRGASVIFSEAPLLAIEIVNPDSITRDYRYKRAEYAALEIVEYWIVDPSERKVTVLDFNEGLYEETVFVGDQTIVSTRFPGLQLTVAQILAAGMLSDIR